MQSLPNEVCLVCGVSGANVDLRVQLSPSRNRDVLTCRACGSSFVQPPLSREDLKLCYPPAYHEDYRAQLSSEFLKGRYLGRALKRWHPAGRFLDVGCSLGGVVAGVVRESSWAGVGIEFSSYAVEEARRLFPALALYPGGLEDLPAAEPEFEFMLVNNVLEHVTRPQTFLQKAWSLMKRGGRLRLIVPNGPVDLAPNRILYYQEKLVLRTKHAGHLFFFSREGLKQMFDQSGFRVIRFGTFHIQAALKACGVFPPGALRRFARQFAGVDHAPPNGQERSPVQAAWAPPGEASWWTYRLKKWTKLPPVPGLSIGYDFDVLLEKPG